MGINSFVLILIIASIFITNINQEVVIKKIEHKNIPLVTFNDSTFYLLDNKEVKKMVKSSQMKNYKNKDELYDATVLIKNKYNNTDIMSAQYILKENDIYKLYSNVDIKINTKNKVSLRSDFIKYDKASSILSNNKPFELKYNNNTILGNDLFYDNRYNIIKAKKVHMNIKREI